MAPTNTETMVNVIKRPAFYKLVAAHDNVIKNKDITDHTVLLDDFINLAFELVDHSNELTADEVSQIKEIFKHGKHKDIFDNHDGISDRVAVTCIMKSMFKDHNLKINAQASTTFRNKFYPYYGKAILG